MTTTITRAPALEELHSGGIAGAVSDMEAAQSRRLGQVMERMALSRAIRLTDELLGDLEGLNLAERTSVPESWQPSLDHVLERLPRSCQVRLSASDSIADLMDRVYDAQDCLLGLRAQNSAAAGEGSR